jgi:Uma2 family endonuclease
LPEECDREGNVFQHELIHGEVVTMPHAAKRHDTIRSNILEILFAYFKANRSGRVRRSA